MESLSLSQLGSLSSLDVDQDNAAVLFRKVKSQYGQLSRTNANYTSAELLQLGKVFVLGASSSDLENLPEDSGLMDVAANMSQFLPQLPDKKVAVMFDKIKTMVGLGDPSASSVCLDGATARQIAPFFIKDSSSDLSRLTAGSRKEVFKIIGGNISNIQGLTRDKMRNLTQTMMDLEALLLSSRLGKPRRRGRCRRWRRKSSPSRGPPTPEGRWTAPRWRAWTDSWTSWAAPTSAAWAAATSGTVCQSSSVQPGSWNSSQLGTFRPKLLQTLGSDTKSWAKEQVLDAGRLLDSLDSSEIRNLTTVDAHVLTTLEDGNRALLLWSVTSNQRSNQHHPATGRPGPSWQGGVASPPPAGISSAGISHPSQASPDAAQDS